MNMEIQIETVSEIVRSAAVFMDRTGGFEIHDKGARENIVTSSDLAVQHFLTVLPYAERERPYAYRERPKARLSAK